MERETKFWLFGIPISANGEMEESPSRENPDL